MAMTLSFNGISFSERVGSMVLSLERGKLGGKRVIQCAWADGETLAESILGYSQDVDGDVVVTTPWTWPTRSDIHVRKVNIKGVGKSSHDTINRCIQYDRAELELVYDNEGKLSDQGDDDPESTAIITESLDIATQVITVPGRHYQWTDASGDRIEQNVGLLIGVEELTITEHGLTSLKKTAIRTARGKVNTSAYLGFAAECLLYQGAVVNNVIESMGYGLRNLMDVSHKFLGRTESWNKLVAPDGTWKVVFPKPYTAGSLAGVFTY